MTVFETALDGLNRATTALEGTVGRLARLPLAHADPPLKDTVNLSAAMVALLEARNVFQINARVLRTAFEMEEHLLEVLG